MGGGGNKYFFLNYVHLKFQKYYYIMTYEHPKTVGCSRVMNTSLMTITILLNSYHRTSLRTVNARRVGGHIII